MDESKRAWRLCWYLAIFLSLSIVLRSGVAAEDALQKCVSISNKLDRLACFDAYIKARELKTDKIEADIKWKAKTEKDPITDGLVSLLSIDASKGENRLGNHPRLVLKCKDKLQEIYISWGTFISNRPVPVTARIREEPAFTHEWSISSDNTATFYTYSVELISKLRTGGRFVAKVTPHSENPITAIFNVDGLDGALKGVENDCNW